MSPSTEVQSSDLPMTPDPAPPSEVDVVPFVLSEPAAPAAGRTLEVHQAWGTTLLATRQFPPGHGAVRVGLQTGHRWRFLGIDMGFVSRPMGAVLPVLAPLWSDVETGWRSDFVVDADALPDAAGWTLFDVGPEGDAVARVAADWDGFLEVDGERTPLRELVARGAAVVGDDGVVLVPVPPGARLVVEAGGSVFFARRVTPPPRSARAEPEVDGLFAGALSVGALVFLLMVVAMWVVPPDRSNAMREVPPQLVEMLLDVPTQQVATVASPPEDAGRRAAGAEGRTGPKKPDRSKPRSQRVLDRETAEHAGLLGAMDDDAVAAVLGSAALSSGLEQGVSGLVGSTGTPGFAGLGQRGGQFGGGGDAESLGGIRTHGDGGHGFGIPGGPGKSEGTLSQTPREAVVLGQLDRALIDEVVKRNLSSLRYCYQRELNRSPELSGKVVMKFTIAGDGSVTAASTRSSTLGSAEVESCMQRRFLTMKFPPPEAGGIVLVSYPFVFSRG